VPDPSYAPIITPAQAKLQAFARARLAQNTPAAPTQPNLPGRGPLTDVDATQSVQQPSPNVGIAGLPYNVPGLATPTQPSRFGPEPRTSPDQITYSPQQQAQIAARGPRPPQSLADIAQNVGRSGLAVASVPVQAAYDVASGVVKGARMTYGESRSQSRPHGVPGEYAANHPELQPTGLVESLATGFTSPPPASASSLALLALPGMGAADRLMIGGAAEGLPQVLKSAGTALNKMAGKPLTVREAAINELRKMPRGAIGKEPPTGATPLQARMSKALMLVQQQDAESAARIGRPPIVNPLNEQVIPLKQYLQANDIPFTTRGSGDTQVVEFSDAAKQELGKAIRSGEVSVAYTGRAYRAMIPVGGDEMQPVFGLRYSGLPTPNAELQAAKGELADLPRGAIGLPVGPEAKPPAPKLTPATAPTGGIADMAKAETGEPLQLQGYRSEVIGGQSQREGVSYALHPNYAAAEGKAAALPATLLRKLVSLKNPLVVDGVQGELLDTWAAQGDKEAMRLVKIPDQHGAPPPGWYREADAYIAKKAASLGHDGIFYRAPLARAEVVELPRGGFELPAGPEGKPPAPTGGIADMAKTVDEAFGPSAAGTPPTGSPPKPPTMTGAVPPPPVTQGAYGPVGGGTPPGVPPGGTAGAVPPAAGVPGGYRSVDELKQAIIASLDLAGPARKALEGLKSEELSRRLGMSAHLFEGDIGANTMRQFGRNLAGPLAPAAVELPELGLKPAEYDSLINHLKTVDFQPVTGFTPHAGGVDQLAILRTSKALNKVLLNQVPQENELRLLEAAYGPEFVQAILNKRPLWEKLQIITARIINAPREILASMDFSAPFRQGAVLSVAHPKEFWGSFVPGIKAIASDKQFGAVMDSIYANPWYKDMVDSKLYLPDPRSIASGVAGAEEQFPKSFAESIPGLKQMVGASNRAYVGYLNKLRSDTFANIVKGWEEGGNIVLKEDKRLLADFINKATGRGNLGPLNRIAPLMNTVFFSPRFAASRVELLGALTGPSGLASKEAAKTILAAASGGIGLLAMAHYFGKASVELDPRSTDFMKIRVGEQRIDLWGGFQPWIRLAAQEVTGQRKAQGSDQIRDVSRIQTAWNFTRGKFGPAAALTADVVTGKTFTGQPVTPGGEAQNMLVPFGVQDVTQGAQLAGGKGGAIGSLSLVGVGVQSPKGVTSYQDIVSRQKFNMPYKDLGKDDKRTVDADPRVVAAQAQQAPPEFNAKEYAKGAWAQLATRKGELETGLRKAIDDGVSGKNLTKAVQEFKSARFQAAKALITPEMTAARAYPATQVRDILAEQYWGANAPQSAVTGGPDFAARDAARATVLAQARAAGVPLAYITQKGPNTYLGDKQYTDPKVKQLLTSYETDQETLKPYWEVAALNPNNKAMVAFQNKRREQMFDFNNGDNDIRKALIRWGYRKAPGQQAVSAPGYLPQSRPAGSAGPSYAPIITPAQQKLQAFTRQRLQTAGATP